VCSPWRMSRVARLKLEDVHLGVSSFAQGSQLQTGVFSRLSRRAVPVRPAVSPTEARSGGLQRVRRPCRCEGEAGRVCWGPSQGGSQPASASCCCVYAGFKLQTLQGVAEFQRIRGSSSSARSFSSLDVRVSGSRSISSDSSQRCLTGSTASRLLRLIRADPARGDVALDHQNDVESRRLRQVMSGVTERVPSRFRATQEPKVQEGHSRRWFHPDSCRLRR